MTTDCFQYREKRLWCEDVAVESLVERFGTPLYVYSLSAILFNYHRLERDLARLPSLICYSVKANSSLKILRALRQAGAGFDVVSGGELARALKVGADPGRVVFSGVGKTSAEIDAALSAGILMFNVESPGELDVLESRARAASKRAAMAIRVNPDVETETHPYVSTGQTIHKFGVPKEEAIELYRRAARSPHLEIRGIACHIGSQILEVGPYLQALDEVLGVARQLEAFGVRPQDLDVGGGFGIRYLAEQPFDFELLTTQLGARLAGAHYRLILEPGRSMVGDAGILVARVLYVKRSAKKNFVVVDAGMNDLVRPALYGSYHEIVPLRQGAAGKIRADVVGPLCETGDFLAQDRLLPEVESGDLLAILTAGAYGYALASNYNTRPRPAEVLVRASQVELMRRRETLEDLLNLEVF